MGLQNPSGQYKIILLCNDGLTIGHKQKLELIGINPARLTEDKISRSVTLVSPISGYVKAVNVSIENRYLRQMYCSKL